MKHSNTLHSMRRYRRSAGDIGTHAEFQAISAIAELYNFADV